MGAFGNLLQQYFGGTVHDVSTWGSSSNKKQYHQATDSKNNKTLKCELCGRFAKRLVYAIPLRKFICPRVHSHKY